MKQLLTALFLAIVTIGTVVDDRGFPVPGVRVEAISPNDYHAATTDITGTFRISNLQPEPYIVRLSRPGYRPIIYAGATVIADPQQRLVLLLPRQLTLIKRITGT